MNEPIEVVRANILEDGVIVSEFNGFDGSSRFGFASGYVWEQAEYKYSHHYAHRPHAIVVDGVNGIELLGRAHHDPARQHGRGIL
jgi:hypothetical protein